MQISGAVAIVAAVLVMGGCSPSADVPATTPTPSASAPTEQPESPSSTSSTTTTTAPETTTTVDRLTEITAIFEDLEHRRLAAIYSGDVEAFTELFADTPYLERSLEVFDIIEPGEPPILKIEVLEVLRDDADCLAIWSRSLVGSADEDTGPRRHVLLPLDPGWGYAFTSPEKEGWLCDGPHPLSS